MERYYAILNAFNVLNTLPFKLLINVIDSQQRNPNETLSIIGICAFVILLCSHFSPIRIWICVPKFSPDPHIH